MPGPGQDLLLGSQLQSRDQKPNLCGCLQPPTNINLSRALTSTSSLVTITDPLFPPSPVKPTVVKDQSISITINRKIVSQLPPFTSILKANMWLLGNF